MDAEWSRAQPLIGPLRASGDSGTEELGLERRGKESSPGQPRASLVGTTLLCRRNHGDCSNVGERAQQYERK